MQDADLGHAPPSTGRVARQVDNDVQRGGQLAVDRLPTQARRASQGFKPGGHVRGGVGVEGAAAAFVARVERLQENNYLWASDLPDHQAVGTHAERLADEIVQCHASGAFHVRRTGLQPHDMRMGRFQLGGVFDEEESFGRVHQGQHAAQEGGLAGSGTAGDQERGARLDQGGEDFGALGWDGPGRYQLVQGERATPGQPERQARATRGHRRQDGMEPDPARQTGVGVGGRVVEPASGCGGEALRQAPQRRLVREADRRADETGARVSPHLVRAVDQDIGDVRGAQHDHRGGVLPPAALRQPGRSSPPRHYRRADPAPRPTTSSYRLSSSPSEWRLVVHTVASGVGQAASR